MRTIICIISVSIWILLYFLGKADAFEAGDCVYNQQFRQTKQITKVRTFVYEYCIYNNLDCKGQFIIRKNWFDKNHEKAGCPKEK